MTCAQFRELAVVGDLADVTRAERWAVRRHYQQCAACRDDLDQAAEEEEARYGPLTPAAERAIDRQHARLNAADALDPEVQL